MPSLELLLGSREVIERKEVESKAGAHLQCTITVERIMIGEEGVEPAYGLIPPE